VREEVRIQRRVGEHPNIVFMKEFVETETRSFSFSPFFFERASEDCFHTHTYIHTYTHAHMHTCTHAHMHNQTVAFFVMKL
jgi:hypothetical protein